MEKSKINLNLVKNIINEFKDDGYMLLILTDTINELQNLDPVWNDSIHKIIKLKITRKFKRKITYFLKQIKNINHLLILNILLEAYDTIDDLTDFLQEDAFYVILKELIFILNEQNLNFQNNYTKCLKLLKQFRNALIS
ncbi:hypothetical protein crov129 [Cafeteria roenbergensis virus]|uniref:Uncharacterized protein n=1 Tax=Cafeteria roenbergensis virus (strain BV-PW1) TaxID=693272 RepID=E3T4P9_CROVB|nr:hypothetical protein crov129 [Cafeteria roenbergensis virus BV-PW1]ADO67162.1 hypothetical protein crov129 [Cafeteria roenbergensis virus BV-PW1]